MIKDVKPPIRKEGLLLLSHRAQQELIRVPAAHTLISAIKGAGVGLSTEAGVHPLPEVRGATSCDRGAMDRERGQKLLFCSCLVGTLWEGWEFLGLYLLKTYTD